MVSILLNQWLVLTMLWAMGPWLLCELLYTVTIMVILWKCSVSFFPTFIAYGYMKNIPYITDFYISVMVLSLLSILKRTLFKLSFLLDCVSRINSISSCFIFVVVLFLLTFTLRFPQHSGWWPADWNWGENLAYYTRQRNRCHNCDRRRNHISNETCLGANEAFDWVFGSSGGGCSVIRKIQSTLPSGHQECWCDIVRWKCGPW